MSEIIEEINYTIGEKNALHTAKLDEIRKQMNANSWNDNTEDLMKSWGMKSAGLRWLHFQSATKWNILSNRLSLPIILLSTLTGIANFGATNAKQPEMYMYVLGSLNILTAFIASLKQFYNAEKKNQLHMDVGKQFGSFYRQIVLELSLPRSDRKPCKEMSTWAKMEFDRLQLDAPPIGGDVISKFNQTFSQLDDKPDVVSESFDIQIHGREQ